MEDEENEVQEESESDFENKCIQCGNEIIKKKHQENGKHLNICYDWYKDNKLKDRCKTEKEQKAVQKEKESKKKRSDEKEKLQESVAICRKWQGEIGKTSHQENGKYLDICYACYKKKKESKRMKGQAEEEEDKQVEPPKENKRKRNKDHVCSKWENLIGEFYFEEKPQKYKDYCVECFNRKIIKKEEKEKRKHKEPECEICRNPIGDFINIDKVVGFESFWHTWYYEELEKKGKEKEKKRKKKQITQKDASFEDDLGDKKVGSSFVCASVNC